MKRLSENDHIDLYRHLAFCAVGGFFGCYAVLVHGGIMGNAQTTNLLELVIDLLRWQLPDMLLHLGALALYVLGTMLTVLLPHWCGADMHRVSPAITAAMAVVLFLLPPELDPVVALYPIFFAMSIQWSSFAGARGFYSSTIFSTNNTKQTSLALAGYLCDRDRAHLRKMWFFLASAGAKQVATVYFTNLLLTVIRKLLLPLLYACIAAAAADAMVPGHSLKKISAGISKAVTWALTASMLAFTGFLTLTGAATGAADAMTVQMTRSAIATAVPVVGSIISEATGTVLAGAGVLKGAIGIFGMLAVLSICLTPFLSMAVQYLLYKLTAFLAGTVTEGPLAGLINALGTAFGLMLGMTGSCALLLLISITSSVSAVLP